MPELKIKDILIIGGSSGLGLELAKKYMDLGHRVTVTGRKDPRVIGVTFLLFDISADANNLPQRIDDLVSGLGPINTLIYSAGYYQEGHIDQLSDEDIVAMVNVGLTAPMLLVKKLKKNPGAPLKVMFITSSSQYTPRELEPVYTAVKSGLGMLGNSLGLDAELGKVCVFAPSGMNTPFWKDGRDASQYLDPSWVADQIIELSGGPFKYKYAQIIRNPSRVEVIEVRQNK
jgi:NAD(P)-dependent dehydrogenase (short-subunit alcohol dehydrogenase family)